MIFLGYIAIAAQVGLSVVTDLLRRKIAVADGALGSAVSAVAYWAQVLTGAAFILVTGVDIVVDLKVIGAALLISMAPPLRELFHFKASERVDAGSLSVLTNLTTVVTVLFAALLLGDVLSVVEFLGTALIVVAAVVVARITSGHARFSLLVFVVVAPLIFFDTVSNLGPGWFIEEYSLSLFLFYGLIFQAVWSVMLVKDKKSSFKALASSDLRKPLGGYIGTRAIKGILFLVAIDLLQSVATVKAITSITPIVITVAAYFYLSEKNHVAAKLVAALIAAGGLALFTV